MLVNFAYYPFMNVLPRKYWFRILSAAACRGSSSFSLRRMCAETSGGVITVLPSFNWIALPLDSASRNGNSFSSPWMSSVPRPISRSNR